MKNCCTFDELPKPSRVDRRVAVSAGVPDSTREVPEGVSLAVLPGGELEDYH